jgi:hypothetical protein
VKIFVSYSRRDADFAQQIEEYFQGSGHDVFTDVKDIQAGVIWTSAIENNISNCDIFVVIVTHASLRSLEVEKEVLQAQRENKKIIPSIHKDVDYNEIKWNLKSIQGIEFQDKYELSRVLYSKIAGKRKESPRPADDYITKRQRLSLKIIIPIISIIGVLSSVFLAFNFFDDLIESNVNTNNGNLSLNVQPGNTNNVSSLHIHNLHKTTTMNRSVNIQLIANDKDDNDYLNINYDNKVGYNYNIVYLIVVISTMFPTIRII